MTTAHRIAAAALEAGHGDPTSSKAWGELERQIDKTTHRAGGDPEDFARGAWHFFDGSVIYWAEATWWIGGEE